MNRFLLVWVFLQRFLCFLDACSWFLSVARRVKKTTGILRARFHARGRWTFTWKPLNLTMPLDVLFEKEKSRVLFCRHIACIVHESILYYWVMFCRCAVARFCFFPGDWID